MVSRERRTGKKCISCLVYSFCILILCTLMIQGCKKTELTSQWKDTDIVIDGDHTDWKDHLSLIEKHNVSIGMQHNDEFLYMCLATTDKQIQNQFLRMGLKLWLSPEDGKKRQFGIHYPIGLMGSGISMRELSSNRGLGDQEQNAGRMEDLITRSLFELEVLGPEEGDIERMHVNQAQSMEIKINRDEGLLVYELKIPRIRDEKHPYALGMGPQAMLICGFETGEVDLDQMRSDMGNRMGGGGMRGGGGRGRGGGSRGRPGGGPPTGGMRGGGMMERPEPVKIWTQIMMDSGTQ